MRKTLEQTENEVASYIKFPAEFWEIFNSKWSIQPIYKTEDVFHCYQLINQSDGTKYGKPLDLMEMMDFMNESWEAYQKELESIILG